MDAAWFELIRAYCERVDPGFWAEPLNAVSNAAFLIAAAAAALRERRGAVRDPAARALAALVLVVGIGSFLFHTLAQRWAMLADVIPIALFIYAYFLLAMRRFLGLGAAGALAATLAFAAFGAGLAPLLDAATGLSSAQASNGSIDYVPALLGLLGVAAGLLVTPQTRALAPARRVAGRRLLAIAGLFLVSLICRTLDRALCAGLPTGTHFLWHALNAAVLYGLIETARQVRGRAAGAAR
ncbi:ceramidase domain-containing protein [Methylobacterium planeticum]|uniref:Ceramidase n=1 Tax=Methylobacterium planeticum TaxID=2615211 RepID=A0A6N6MRS7_9HYPH|nr:ceramidase domain-containing protein [Methylobacterium planeticum]KAB1073020.1 hypothetical protein F6X51_13650 [Methylobacterium planeticum]